MFLNPQELIVLTGKERFSAQARELNHMKIPFHRRSDGSLVVAREFFGVREPRIESAKSRVKLRSEWAVQ